MNSDARTATAAHTPGPWRGIMDGDCGWIFDRDFKKIADIFSLPDGRLIAAAPDMLAALLDIASTLDIESYPHPGSKERRVGNVARAAIAKATGAQ